MAYNASSASSPSIYQLNNTPYKAEFDRFVFYFSTERHRDNFVNCIDKRIGWMNDSMSRRFHFPIDCKFIAVFQLYMQVEGRGFQVFDTKTYDEYTSPSQLRMMCEVV